MRNLIVLVCIITVSSVYSSELPERKNALALGEGLETGIFGFAYNRWLGDSPYQAGLGAGLEGIMPNLKRVLWYLGNFQIYGQTSIFYSPFGFLLFGGNSLVPIAGIGLQYWSATPGPIGLYLNVSAGVGYLVMGEVEGTTKVIPNPNIQVGLTY